MKALAIDIETVFATAGVWGLYDQNVAINQVLDPGGMICWAAKWIGQEKMHFAKKGDKGFLTKLHDLLNEADCIVSYNGQRFDMRKINREFLVAGMKPPAPYKHVDLLKVVKKQFAMLSNKLDWVSRELGIGEKIKHEGFPLWIKCAAGNREAWKQMRSYNEQDVLLLEQLYDRLLPWINSHPNKSLEAGMPCCTNCGSHNLQRRGYHVTKTARYARLACQDCGSWMRQRAAAASPKEILVGL